LRERERLDRQALQLLPDQLIGLGGLEHLLTSFDRLPSP